MKKIDKLELNIYNLANIYNVFVRKTKFFYLTNKGYNIMLSYKNLKINILK